MQACQKHSLGHRQCWRSRCCASLLLSTIEDLFTAYACWLLLQALRLLDWQGFRR
jgi:hypothetical protein